MGSGVAKFLCPGRVIAMAANKRIYELLKKNQNYLLWAG